MSAKFTLKFNLEVFCLSHKPYLIILIFQLTTYTQSAPAACNQALRNITLDCIFQVTLWKPGGMCTGAHTGNVSKRGLFWVF